MSGYLRSCTKENCFGCEACASICPRSAIAMTKDDEGFRYPTIDNEKCINCGQCLKVCPFDNMPDRFSSDKYVYGGYHSDVDVRSQSTSGGAFSAISEAFCLSNDSKGAMTDCSKNYVIFGAEAKGLSVFHSYITDISELYRFRKSKYSQSVIGDTYRVCKEFLLEGKKVVFSGTPCQIAGLKAFLNNHKYDNLLTVEVICEGVPSPYYMEKYQEKLERKYGEKICQLDYRYTASRPLNKPKKGKWDFQVMYTRLNNGKEFSKDRWFNPFWSIWLNHLMSRPSCYTCPFASVDRVADISLGDLWGVHLYCPELYGRNMGASLVVCNTPLGKTVFSRAQTLMIGHTLDFQTALKYQSPMRKSIDRNPDREQFMAELKDSKITYDDINKKWAKKPTVNLLWNKYVWGNRQKIAFWNLTHKKGSEMK